MTEILLNQILEELKEIKTLIVLKSDIIVIEEDKLKLQTIKNKALNK